MSLTWQSNRWHLEDKPIHAGAMVELLGEDGEWFEVRIETEDSGRKLLAYSRVHGLEFRFPLIPDYHQLRWHHAG